MNIKYILAVFLLSFFYLVACNNGAKEEQAKESADSTEERSLAKEDALQGAEEKEENKDTLGELPKPETDSVKVDSVESKKPVWPVKKPESMEGSLLPSHRIIAYYGNLYSKRMGILGEYAPEIVLEKLQKEVDEWQAADPEVKTIPALELIAVSGQGTPMPDKKYRMRMPFWMVDSVIQMAKQIDAQVFLDIQVGHSTVQEEIPHFEEYWKLPNVHLAVDPEFSMKDSSVPGKKIGTMDAKDINYCIQYLKEVVKENNLPPKLLVVHRFTQGMLTNYSDIGLEKEVQVIINMDGFGSQALKRNTYKRYIYKEPVEFTGVKIFYKNDSRNGNRLMLPEDVLQLNPIPFYIQYQ